MESNEFKIGVNPSDMLRDRRIQVSNAIDKLRKELEQIDAALGAIEGVSNRSSVGNDNSNDRKSINWKKMILPTLKKHRHLMQNRQIVEANFPNLTNEKEKGQLVVKCAGALLNMKKRKLIKSTDVFGGRGDWFGLPEWFEGNTVKDEYEPK